MFFLTNFLSSEPFFTTRQLTFFIKHHASDWIKTRDYASWAPLYDDISPETFRYPFHLLKRTIYTGSPSTGSLTAVNQHESPHLHHGDNVGSPLSRYHDDEDDDENTELKLPPALSTGPNWNRNVPLPAMLKVINTSFDFEKPCNSRVTFNREDQEARFQITEEYRALAAEAEVPSSFEDLEKKVQLPFIVTLRFWSHIIIVNQSAQVRLSNWQKILAEDKTRHI